MVDATRDLILDADDIELVKVTVPGWKDRNGNLLDVYIKQMSGKDAEEYLSATDEHGVAPETHNIKIVLISVCDSHGNRLFNKKDYKRLSEKNSRIITWLFNKILEINFSAISIEEQAKN